MLQTRLSSALFSILFLSQVAIGQPVSPSETANPPSSSSSVYESAAASATSNNDSSGVEPGNYGAVPTSAAGMNAAGASGASTGSIDLSTGATIAIVVVAVIVVILAGVSARLFFVAKKRQWRVKETLRRSARRVGTFVATPFTPRTPKPMSFPQPKEATEFESKDNARGQLRIDTSSKAIGKGPKQHPGPPPSSYKKAGVDVEKGFGTRTTIVATKSGFDADSPKTPLITKMLGRM